MHVRDLPHYTLPFSTLRTSLQQKPKPKPKPQPKRIRTSKAFLTSLTSPSLIFSPYLNSTPDRHIDPPRPRICICTMLDYAPCWFLHHTLCNPTLPYLTLMEKPFFNVQLEPERRFLDLETDVGFRGWGCVWTHCWWVGVRWGGGCAAIGIGSALFMYVCMYVCR